jgi:hypothetical protein
MFSRFPGASRSSAWMHGVKDGYRRLITRFYVPRARGDQDPTLVGRPRRFPWLPYQASDTSRVNSAWRCQRTCDAAGF